MRERGRERDIVGIEILLFYVQLFIITSVQTGFSKQIKICDNPHSHQLSTDRDGGQRKKISKLRKNKEKLNENSNKGTLKYKCRAERKLAFMKYNWFLECMNLT